MKFFPEQIFHPTFSASNTKNTCWIRLKWFNIQHLICSTISNVDFNVFNRSNVYSNVFIKNNQRWLYSFSSQFYSTTIKSSSEEETSSIKESVFKMHMKDKEKQEKAKMVQEVADDKMTDG